MTGPTAGCASLGQAAGRRFVDTTEGAILAAAVGAAAGSKAAAAALACAGSEPDRAGLLIDLAPGRAPRPTPVASTAARELEERLAVHLPEAGVASHGRTCHLALPADRSGLEGVAAALPLVRDSIAVVHLPPCLFQPALEEPRMRPSAALLRADLTADRALTALAVRDLIERGLRVAVLKQPLGWIAARRALAGLLSVDAGGGLPRLLRRRLLAADSALPAGVGASAALLSHECYDTTHDAEAEPARTAQQEWRDHASPRSGRGLHRHPQRGAGR